LTTPSHTSKQALRLEIRKRLAGMAGDDRVAASTRARALLERQPLWKRAQSVLFYAPLAEELDVWPLLKQVIEAGKIAALPAFESISGSYNACQVQHLEADLKTGKFGIREPEDHCQKLSLNRLDLILVPGVAFDLQGRRLGRGKGYYDRLLAAVSGTRCGVAFDEQIVAEVPAEPHDASVNCILTPTRWIEL